MLFKLHDIEGQYTGSYDYYLAKIQETVFFFINTHHGISCYNNFDILKFVKYVTNTPGIENNPTDWIGYNPASRENWLAILEPYKTNNGWSTESSY